MDRPLHILISNDDGIDAPGLDVLERAVRALDRYRVTVVAPSEQQSGSSHALTLTSPLRILDRGEDRYAVTGTPTDSVLVAISKILKDDLPDVVLSGINHGPNMGEDVIYSGTVAAAMEGTMIGLPSYAFSLAEWGPKDFSGAGDYIRRRLPGILDQPLPRGTLLNINIPELPYEKIAGTRITRLGTRVYTNVITDQVDPHGRPYFWIGGQGPTWTEENGTDYTAVQQGHVSITPLQIDLTAQDLLPKLRGLEKDGLK